MDEPLERLIKISTEGARLYKIFMQLKLSGKRTGEGISVDNLKLRVIINLILLIKSLKYKIINKNFT